MDSLSIIHELQAQGSEEKFFLISPALYLGEIELIIIGLMGTLNKGLKFLLSFGNMEQKGAPILVCFQALIKALRAKAGETL